MITFILIVLMLIACVRLADELATVLKAMHGTGDTGMMWLRLLAVFLVIIAINFLLYVWSAA